MKKSEIATIADALAPVIREYVEKSVREALELPIRSARQDERADGKSPRHSTRKADTVDFPGRRPLPVVYLDNRSRRTGVVWL